MYKVLLVDDEYYYREALKNTVSWEFCGCQICGEANNGRMGVEKAKELRPDIILADVNMPFMDGLQMIEEIQKTLPDTMFALITGYGEFEYAKRGMELGVKYYVVKPVDDQELMKNLSRMVQELDARKEQKNEYASLRFWADKNARENQRKFLEMLLAGNDEITTERFFYECENLRMPIQNGGYAVCCLRVTVGSPINPTVLEWEEKIKKMLEEESDTQNYVLHCSPKCMRILFFDMAPHEWDEIRMRALMQRLQIKCMHEMVCTVVAGVGCYCLDYTEIPTSCAEAEEAMIMITTSDLIMRMLQYIHENYADPDLTLHKIAEALYSNYSYLSAQFTKELGMSASQYISRFRMTKAANDLRSGKDNMVQIACDVGFTDVKYFYRCFKKEFEITPYQYIEMLRKNKSQENPPTKAQNETGGGSV